MCHSRQRQLLITATEAKRYEAGTVPCIHVPALRFVTSRNLNVEAQNKCSLESIPESHRYIWADDVSKRSLYIGNMSTQVTKEEVRALSEAIRGVRFVNRRSAFLDFESPEVASAQLEVLRTMQLKGQPIQIEPSRPRASSAFKSDRLVYVRGFPDDKGMEALGPLFPAALLIDRREGKVLLRFKDHESAISAIKEVIAQDGIDYKFSFAAARPRWNRRGPPRALWRRPPGKFVKHETRQD